jgi:hypothetical protein
MKCQIYNNQYQSLLYEDIQIKQIACAWMSQNKKLLIHAHDLWYTTP